MRQLLLILIVPIALVYACNHKDRAKTVSSSRTIPEPDIIDRLKYQKSSIDTLVKRSQDTIETFIKLTGENKLLPFKDSVLPEETEISFYIVRDSSKRIVEITESPYSKSGDWYITLTHYFDKNGKTFAFVSHTNFFNSGCTNGVAYETKTNYYNSEFELIGRNYQLVDEKGKELKSDSCTFLYEYPYNIYPTVNKYIKAYRIPDSR